MNLWHYFVARASTSARTAFDGVASLRDWQEQAPARREEFFLSVGLDPLPPREGLRCESRGHFSGEGFVAERFAYELAPDAWAAGALFLPADSNRSRFPAVLYPCGHGPRGLGDYHNHSIFWARRGYACFIVDTLEQGDNRGEHHGLYLNMHPEWLSLGYSAAGGELWNCLRALDVLCASPRVDAGRIGVTGASGGGILSLLTAIADPRIKAAAVICGVSTPEFALRNRHLLHHCDCVFPHHRFVRDTSELAALVAPRPLLFCYAEGDSLFSPAEYQGLVERTRRVYQLHGCPDRCELLTAPGPHGDKPATVARTQSFFDQHVAGEEHPTIPLGGLELPDSVVTVYGHAPPSPNNLDLLPRLLCPLGVPPLPARAAEWPAIRDAALRELERRVLRPAPRAAPAAQIESVRESLIMGAQMKKLRATIEGVEAWVDLVIPDPSRGLIVGLCGQDEPGIETLARLRGSATDWATAAVEPRVGGINSPAAAFRGRLLRAAALVGLTPITMMVEDFGLLLPRIADAAGSDRAVVLHGRGEAAVACLYHALLDPRCAGLVLEDLPASHLQAAPMIGVLRLMDLSHALGFFAERPVALVNPGHSVFHWAQRLYGRLGAADRLFVAPTLTAALTHMRRHLDPLPRN